MICRYFVSVEMVVSFDIISIPKKWLVFMAKCEDPKFVRAGILIRSYVFNGPFIRATKQFYKNRLQAFCTKKENNTFYKNRLQGFCREETLHCFRLIFPRLFSHPWKVCLWRSLVWKKHQNHTSLLSKCPPSESTVSKKIGNIEIFRATLYFSNNQKPAHLLFLLWACFSLPNLCLPPPPLPLLLNCLL